MESLSTIARSVAGTLCAAVLVTSIPSHAYAGVTSQAEVDVMMAEAQAAVDAADEADARLVGLMDALRIAYDDYLSASGDITKVSAERADISKKLQEMDAADASARKAADFASAELSRIDGDWLAFVLDGGMSFSEAEDYRNLLEKLASYDGEDERAESARARLESRDSELGRRLAEEREAVQGRVDACNEAAAEIEKCCSEIRQGDRAAGEAVDAIDDAVEGIADTRAQLSQIQAVHRENRQAGSDLAAEWYDVLDGLSGRGDAAGALTFGAGAEFALSEDEFVAKWGAAIDSYYDDYSSGVGRDVPLCGYGRAMARAAWKWHVDPRLCAAVSVTESSGGLYCIRPHNAWGWGAADSDPYNLAWEWGSWEQAIEAWHEGVATSTTGLADAGSLEEFGSVYASSPAWPGNTATYMQEVADHAR